MTFNLYQPEEENTKMPNDISFRAASIAIFFLAVGISLYMVFGIREEEKKDLPVESERVQEAVPIPSVDRGNTRESEEEAWHFTPGPISMDLVKKNGCVADGFLSGYGDKTKEMVAMFNRSDCVYLHRSLET